MATTLNTDVAVNLNITARRNDTFKMILQVKDSEDAAIPLNGSGEGSGPAYQGKMSIISTGGEEIMTIFSEYWVGEQVGGTNHPSDIAPEANSTGYYTGGAAPYAITFSVDGEVSVDVPFSNMDFQSGTYNYDFQIRKYPSGGQLEYTTWLYGTFTLSPDITQL
jgi:hypothetical protein